MTVRNYQSPDPARVIENLTKILSAGDMTLLEKGSYDFIITHCGFIAHYNRPGFIEEYRADMAQFVDGFLTHMGFGWDTFLDNRKSYLYLTTYKGRLLSDIIRELIPIFQEYKPAIDAAHHGRKKARHLARLHVLAEELGYDLVPKGKHEGEPNA